MLCEVKSEAWKGSQRGTGIPDHIEDMPGESLNEGTGTKNFYVLG